jgi:hypothetical protein
VALKEISPPHGCHKGEERTHDLGTLEFVEVKMDAEVNSYQDDFGRGLT